MVRVENDGKVVIPSSSLAGRPIGLETLCITYRTGDDLGTKNDLVLWHKPDDKGCSVTLLKGASGVGKSIFVRKVLIPYISNSTDSAFCYIPQNPVQVRHWCLGQVLPVGALEDKRLSALFGGPAQSGGKRYLGQCSGGQIARAYIASAISCLLHETVTQCFLFLDETLDSSGKDMGGYIEQFCDFWKDKRGQKQLYIAIITHHDSIRLRYHSISFTEDSRKEERGREYVEVKLT